MAIDPGSDSVAVLTLSGPTSVSGTANYNGSDGNYLYWVLTVPKLADGTYEFQVTYLHPFGPNFGNYGLTQFTTLPATSGNPHNVNLNFNF